MKINFNIYGGDITNNNFDNILKLKKKAENNIFCYIDLDKTGFMDCCFIVLRNIDVYKKEKLMFNDTIYLVSETCNILDYQKCDSTAGINPTSKQSKKTQDAYTLKPGIYDIQFTRYKNHNAYEILGGLTKGGYRVGRHSKGGDFSARHLIHYIGWKENVTEKDPDRKGDRYRDKLGYKEGSGGCITIPRRLGQDKTILEYNYLASYKTPTQLLIYEYQEV